MDAAGDMNAGIWDILVEARVVSLVKLIALITAVQVNVLQINAPEALAQLLAPQTVLQHLVIVLEQPFQVDALELLAMEQNLK